MQQSTKPKKRISCVTAVLTMRVYAGQKKLSGILRYINECGTIDLDIRTPDCDLTVREIRHQTQLNHLDGLLFLQQPPDDVLASIRKTGIPTVFETALPLIHEPQMRICHISSNTDDLVHQAATHLCSIRPFASFGCVGLPGKYDAPWSADRMTRFKARIEKSGRTCKTITLGQGNLASWLQKLKRPAAIFSVNDETAATVVQSALDVGLSIPEDIAVLGVDDNPLFCQKSKPALSSIVLDFEDCGYQAIRRLHEMILNRDCPRSDMTYECLGIEARASTMNAIPHAQFIQRALTFIHENACHGIGVAQVAEHMGVSRRLLDMRFRAIGKSGLHETIVNRRLDEAHRLVTTTDTPLSSIPDLCGFANQSHLKTLFRNRFGKTMSNIRKERQQGKAMSK